MPFLTLYAESKMLAELGYHSSLDNLDSITATCLVNIKAEITKQENEERDKNAKKGRRKRG
jgi:hypothetical protein